MNEDQSYPNDQSPTEPDLSINKVPQTQLENTSDGNRNLSTSSGEISTPQQIPPKPPQKDLLTSILENPGTYVGSFIAFLLGLYTLRNDATFQYFLLLFFALFSLLYFLLLKYKQHKSKNPKLDKIMLCLILIILLVEALLFIWFIYCVTNMCKIRSMPHSDSGVKRTAIPELSAQ